MKILLLGDTHANFPWLQKSIRHALKNDCTAIIQLGDFGFVPWPHHKNQHIMSTISGEVEKAGLDLYWLDGNHENFDAIEELGAFGAAQMVETHPHVFYLPRGLRWEFDGCRFLSLGGAPSVDRELRVKFVSWWPQEMITGNDLERAARGGEVDIMLTHDVPKGALSQLQYQLEATSGMFGHKLGQDCQYTRAVLAAVVAEVQPKVLVHGHYHYAYEGQLNQTKIFGLDRDGRAEAWKVIDTNDWI